MIRSAEPADASALASLHAQCLPSSLLTLLGRDALTAYYGFACRHEQVWVAEQDLRVVGGCVLSERPASQLRRFVTAHPLVFARSFARRLAISATLRQRLLAGGGGSDEGHAPEVTQIFTDGKLRGQGIGAALLRTCEGTLRGRGHRKYYVHTQRDDNDAGIRFYRREGFVPVGETRSFGEPFLVMQKELDLSC